MGDEITHDFPPFFKVYKDGRIERYMGVAGGPVRPVLHPKSEIQTKDVVISAESGISVRLFTPKFNDPDQKLPLLLHFHGGGFCYGSPSDTVFNNFLSTLASEANIVVVSVDYRLAPENPLPIAYDDSWAATQWVATHSNGKGPESILNQHADFGRVFFAGESAGGTIAHYVAVQVGVTGLLNLLGMIIVHPFFGNKEVNEMYKFMCPTSSGLDDDPKLNPGVDPNLTKLACGRVLVCLAEYDELKSRGMTYYETLEKSGWGGTVELYETQGEEHCFHLFNPTCDKASTLITLIVSFIHNDSKV